MKERLPDLVYRFVNYFLIAVKSEMDQLPHHTSIILAGSLVGLAHEPI